jgi:FixJ family two-component response regulator
MNGGAVDFLPKPVKDKDLLRAIEQALAGAAASRIGGCEDEHSKRSRYNGGKMVSYPATPSR